LPNAKAQRNKLTTEIRQTAVEALRAEAAAVNSLVPRIDEKFEHVVQLVLRSTGRFIVCGMGKSGLVGQKMAATFASTGTPSFFMHPAEALHGDLGMIVPGDILLLISNSGETDEVLRLLPALERFGTTVVAMTGDVGSTLAKAAHHVLDISVEREICPLNLAPTTSTLVTMAMGDALAVALMQARGFEPQDFAKFHPGGSLGRKLLTKVKDVMHTKNLPMVLGTASLRETMLTMTAGRLGLALVVKQMPSPPHNSLALDGLLTDGDLRRALSEKNASLEDPVSMFMTRNPLSIRSDRPFFEAETVMLERKVKCLVVLDDNQLRGVIEIYDR
jgi:arabinose-5-phosphate isomerase